MPTILFILNIRDKCGYSSTKSVKQINTNIINLYIYIYDKYVIYRVSPKI